MNRLNNSTVQSNSSKGSSDVVSKLVDSSNNSDLANLILSIDMITYACLSLIIILFMLILFKFYLNEKNNVKLNLSSWIGEKWNNSLNYYLIKIIQLNKKTSNAYIFIIFVLLFIALLSNCYFITELYSNLDKFVDVHVNSRK